VLIADDHPVVRAGLRALLDGEGISMIAEAADGTSAIAAARRHHPNVVVMDFALPGIDVFAAARELGDVRLVLLTTFETDADVARALRSGAAACVPKDASKSALVAAIRG
jgi:DNA-binding NarL/FixJ family response regulator